ncbi:prolyl-tRNA editing enzyme YbaK/EbsC (Cys-tRNA(Pro) deacylase) [Agromyces sp. 3263]|uniref:YbaK/EbsC family protein n=1 Tax=Agromyces sp. 3263 TaxID=2817750 RepID=UPI002863A68C|nr:YbaK/EbsC family protein [Agromyces sp. 3263]MDR6905781.1 prolyl-tRNA editing enzyme YbaK/EbsC (Cys-tRNA(Pro) deacylase) [Agromyces sp. 3263]
MRFGTLDFTPALDSPGLLAPPTAAALQRADAAGASDAASPAPPAGEVLVVAIDPGLADTAAFCAHYEISMEDGANCVIVQARRGERTWYAACLVRGSDRADVNGVVRRHLDARKLSFAPMDDAVALSGMEYGGITPVGLPADWPILVDESVAGHERLIVGSGVRGSKLLVTGAFLAGLPNAEVLRIAQG